MKRSLLSLVVSLVLAYSAALVGSFFTFGAISTWYATLTKPELSPPNWLFGPVWTILYALMAVAAWRIYEKGKNNQEANKMLLVYLLHLVINSFWSIAFFGLHNPLLAFIVIIVLWLMIAYLVTGFNRIDSTASLLLVPYLVWVSFATYLNLMIVLLN